MSTYLKALMLLRREKPPPLQLQAKDMSGCAAAGGQTAVCKLQTANCKPVAGKLGSYELAELIRVPLLPTCDV
jgi:hypothetical protein